MERFLHAVKIFFVMGSFEPFLFFIFYFLRCWEVCEPVGFE